VNNQPSTSTLQRPSESQRTALIKLLTDEDPEIFKTVRSTILSCGPEAVEWLQPQLLSDDPVLRRRAREIILHFERQDTDIQFLAFCLKHGEEFDLEQGAWLLAATEYPDINVQAYQALLDHYSDELRERIDIAGGARQVVGAINDYLFGELGFVGNESEYYDPENSYLNRVVDRRTGNPVLLCLFYMLLARRLQLPVAGVGLPGHFVCRYQSSSDEIYVDVFNRGQILTKADCVQLLVHGKHGLQDDPLAASSARRMLLRACRNLHQIYHQAGLVDQAIRMQRYLVALAK
jgi:regulator of sirC expression with transglutaminase-like and TPR domain